MLPEATVIGKLTLVHTSNTSNGGRLVAGVGGSNVAISLASWAADCGLCGGAIAPALGVLGRPDSATGGDAPPFAGGELGGGLFDGVPDDSGGSVGC